MSIVADASGSITAGRPPLSNGAVVARALRIALAKLSPTALRKKRALLVIESAASVSFAILAKDVIQHSPSVPFDSVVTALLWTALLFATFAEALAEVRAKAHADALRLERGEMMARRRSATGFEFVPASRLNQGDTVVVEAGELIPADGDVIDGIGTVDESVITGESAPVIRESEHGLNAVSAGTRLLSDELIIRVTLPPGESLLDRMAAALEGIERQRTPDENQKSRLVASFTLAAVAAVIILAPFGIYAVLGLGNLSVGAVLSGLTVSLMPLSIGALLPVIGVAGLDRVMRNGVLVTDPAAVEAAAHIDIALLDKTGTITAGNREAVEFIALPGVSEQELARAAYLSSYADDTPEGRSTLNLARQQYGIGHMETGNAHFIPFSAYTRMSGVDDGEVVLRKGATAAIASFVREQHGNVPPEYESEATGIARTGGTPLGVADGSRLLGIIHLKDSVKEGARDGIAGLKHMDIRPVMITGDNPITARAIGKETGFDDVIAQATPADKLAYIKREQAAGRRVAMTGDGINDAPALAQADVGVALYSGATAARDAGNMVDLDNDPAKLLDITKIACGMLITRSAVTAFSLSKCVMNFILFLAIILPACYPALHRYAILPVSLLPVCVISALGCSILALALLMPLALFGIGSHAREAKGISVLFALAGLLFPLLCIWAGKALLAKVDLY